MKRAILCLVVMSFFGCAIEPETSTSSQKLCTWQMDDNGVWSCAESPGGGGGGGGTGGGGGQPLPNPMCGASCSSSSDCSMLGYDDCRVCSEHGRCVDGTALTGSLDGSNAASIEAAPSDDGLITFCDGRPTCNPQFCVFVDLGNGQISWSCGSGFDNCAALCGTGQGGYCPPIEAGDTSRARIYCSQTLGLPISSNAYEICWLDRISATQHECKRGVEE